MKTYNIELPSDETAVLNIRIWPFHRAIVDAFQYELHHPLPCRVIYKTQINCNYSIEITYNENGNPHSYDNNPAIAMDWEYKRKYYMKDGQLHNTSGPAYVSTNATMYALDGKTYRTFDDWANDLHKHDVSSEDILAIKLKGEQ